YKAQIEHLISQMPAQAAQLANEGLKGIDVSQSVQEVTEKLNKFNRELAGANTREHILRAGGFHTATGKAWIDGGGYERDADLAGPRRPSTAEETWGHEIGHAVLNGIADGDPEMSSIYNAEMADGQISAYSKANPKRSDKVNVHEG